MTKYFITRAWNNAHDGANGDAMGDDDDDGDKYSDGDGGC